MGLGVFPVPPIPPPVGVSLGFGVSAASEKFTRMPTSSRAGQLTLKLAARSVLGLNVPLLPKVDPEIDSIVATIFWLLNGPLSRFVHDLQGLHRLSLR